MSDKCPKCGAEWDGCEYACETFMGEIDVALGSGDVITEDAGLVESDTCLRRQLSQSQAREKEAVERAERAEAERDAVNDVNKDWKNQATALRSKLEEVRDVASDGMAEQDDGAMLAVALERLQRIRRIVSPKEES